VEQLEWSDCPYLLWLTLFVSGATLVCCAVPILLVTIGFGAVAASLSYNVPGLVLLAENKAWTLGLSALLLAWVAWRPGQTCPVDPRLAAYCEQAMSRNRRILRYSVAIWGIGFFFSYLLLPLRQLLNP